MEVTLNNHKVLYAGLGVVFAIPNLAGRFIMLMQAYEWISMINIITTQKNKNINEIMYEINNSESFKLF